MQGLRDQHREGWLTSREPVGLLSAEAGQWTSPGVLLQYVRNWVPDCGAGPVVTVESSWLGESQELVDFTAQQGHASFLKWQNQRMGLEVAL